MSTNGHYPHRAIEETLARYFAIEMKYPVVQMKARTMDIVTVIDGKLVPVEVLVGPKSGFASRIEGKLDIFDGVCDGFKYKSIFLCYDPAHGFQWETNGLGNTTPMMDGATEYIFKNCPLFKGD